MTTIGQLKKYFPKFSEVPVPPSYKRPGDNDHVKIVNVLLREDKSLYAGTVEKLASRLYSKVNMQDIQ
jgi:hypothetical protein